MTISVIMPCFRHARFLEESVEGVLSQSVDDLELIVIDDCSPDDSYERLLGLATKDRRMTVLRHERNQGASSSRNDGLRIARGEFIAFCDADDVWEPEKLAIQLEMLQRYHHHGVAYSDSLIIDEHGVVTGKRFSERYPPPRRSSGDLFNELCQRNFINMQTVMIRRSCLREGMLFDGRIKWVEDWWFWVQLSARCPFLYSSQPLAKYRTHSCSTNITQRAGYYRNRFKVYKRVLDTYPGLPPALASRVWYHMGCCLLRYGKLQSARRLFRQAFSVGMKRWDALPYSARPLFRSVWVGR